MILPLFNFNSYCERAFVVEVFDKLFSKSEVNRALYDAFCRSLLTAGLENGLHDTGAVRIEQ